ncbi:MAG: hypothetical protein KIT57_05105 [Blastocatellales bacterium]|nr:hypothetical protein [Blastocatellales bacterium]
MEIDQSSDRLEYKHFRTITEKLTLTFRSDGFSQSESEQIAFHIAQGIRDVPRLLGMINEIGKYTKDDIIQSVYDVLVNRQNLDIAYSILNRDSMGNSGE